MPRYSGQRVWLVSGNTRGSSNSESNVYRACLYNVILIGVYTVKLEYNTDWQTQARGDNDSEYQIYLTCANDGNGLDFTTGKPLKTYDEWLNS